MKINGKYACVPSWFFKSHFEDVLDRPLTKHQFVLISEHVQEDLMDNIHDMVIEYLHQNRQDIEQMLDEEE